MSAAKPVLLIVDDEPDLRELIEADFQRKGYVVHGAASGFEAWDKLRTLEVDAVLSDVRMANGDGIALLRKIREEYPRSIPVILMTGFADIDEATCRQLGAYRVIAKPFARKDLHDTVTAALSAAAKENGG